MDVYMKSVKWLLDRTRLTSFEKQVLLEVSKVGPGETLTYAQLAERVGRRNAARAVGNALHKNPFIIFVPCHRVVASNGIGGYGRGVLMKKILLAIESVSVLSLPQTF